MSILRLGNFEATNSSPMTLFYVRMVSRWRHTKSSCCFKSFFAEIHLHPLIYLRGFQAKDFGAIPDFLCSGEANIFEECLDSFLAIAEEIKLNGSISGDQTFSEIKKEEEEEKDTEPSSKTQELTTCRKDMKPDADSFSSNT